IAKACCGLPLILEMVGGFLKKERVGVWRQMVENLCEGRPIVKSHTELLAIFRKHLDNGLKDKPIIKECFMDLGLFPKDQNIPVAALIDIWTERQHIPGADLYPIKEADAVNNVYDLTDRYLAKLVVRREVAVDLDDYYNHHFLVQHGLYREMIEASQKQYKQRKRIMFDMNERNWSQQEKNTAARTLSISTSELSTPELGNIVKAEVVEVLVLNLRTNKYTLPEFIGKMKELKVLLVTNYDLYRSELNNFELLDSLSRLKRIRLERVSVTTFGKWHNLQKLSLYNCNAREAFESDRIPISDAMPNLVELCINYCQDLVKLPAGLCDITSIQKLSITSCMGLSALPQVIGNLENLKTLRLSSCAVLEEIPASIGKLLQLRLLDLSGCVSLHNLPEEIGDLLNLERLHMTDCYRCKMPSSVTKLKNLKNVRCDEETAIIWKEDFKPSLPNLKIEEANDHSLFIFYNNI
ncbi:putative disease resistance protein, partial [Mucuna pruriens]